jgi:HEAT repeat protein
MNNLKEYLVTLDHVEEAERMAAAAEIGHLNAPEGVPALLERLAKEPSRAVRISIFRALKRIESDAVIEASIRLLGSDDAEMRNQAVEVLRCKGARSIPFLIPVMRDGDKDLRKLALDSLNGLQGSGSDVIYETALSDPDLNVVITALEYLGAGRAGQFRNRIEELLLAGSQPMLVAACLKALSGIGDEASLTSVRRRFPDLTTLPDFYLVPCLAAIGVLGTAGEIAPVAALLAVRGPNLRAAILGTLSAIHQRYPEKAWGEELLPVLRAIIEDGDPPLCRYQAVRALDCMSSRDDVYSFLISCLSSPERMVRLATVETLRAAPHPGVERVLAALALKETDEEVLQALGC